MRDILAAGRDTPRRADGFGASSRDTVIGRLPKICHVGFLLTLRDGRGREDTKAAVLFSPKMEQIEKMWPHAVRHRSVVVLLGGSTIRLMVTQSALDWRLSGTPGRSPCSAGTGATLPGDACLRVAASALHHKQPTVLVRPAAPEHLACCPMGDVVFRVGYSSWEFFYYAIVTGVSRNQCTTSAPSR